jgi:predicted ATPase
MISSLNIQGYRGFEAFQMANLGRINLLVGTNNCGKTSVLEALYLLATRGEPSSLWELLWRRGERSPMDARNPRQPDFEFDVSHLFKGHVLEIGKKFTLGSNNDDHRSITFSIGKAKDIPDHAPGVADRMALFITGQPAPGATALLLGRNGGISADGLEFSPRRPSRRAAREAAPAQFITTESVDSDDLVALWNKVVLTKNEALVLQALHALDRDIERIAAHSAPSFSLRMRGGFLVKLKDNDIPIPIGSMGDGMWRMLAMAIAITQCKGGVLLVDDIDTGLHYTVMADMWRLILSAAKELDVQVFATTHSLDCIESLARAWSGKSLGANEVTLQRIEAGKAVAVPYTEAELAMVAERGIEAR